MAIKAWGNFDANWTVAADWSSTGQPGADEDVLLAQGNPSITSDVGSVQSVTITQTGQLTQTRGADLGRLQASGDFTNHGRFTQIGSTLVSGSYANSGTSTIQGLLQASSLVNTGLILGQPDFGDAIYERVSVTGVVTNSGTINFTSFFRAPDRAINFQSGDFTNSGSVSINSGASINISGTLTNSGYVISDAASGQTTSITATSLFNTSKIEVGDASQANDFSSSLIITSASSGSGTIFLHQTNYMIGTRTATNVVELGGASDNNVVFAGNSETATLKLNMPSAGFTGTISGFTVGDTLDLAETISGYSYDGATLTVTPTGGGPIQTFALTGTSNALAAMSDGNGGTAFVVCFLRGTLISTTQGDVAVEALVIGDVVVTASGALRPIRWIGHRRYIGRFANANPDLLPVCFRAGALADAVPARDLWVSPKHAMYLDGALVPAEHLVNGVSVIKAKRVESVDYYHVELDSHDVLLAEGAPSESFVDDDGRQTFQNAHEHAALYPEAVRTDAVYCAPRLQHGFALEAIRRRIDVRARKIAAGAGLAA